MMVPRSEIFKPDPKMASFDTNQAFSASPATGSSSSNISIPALPSIIGSSNSGSSSGTYSLFSSSSSQPVTNNAPLTNNLSRQRSLKNQSHGLGGNYSSGGWDMQAPMSSVPVQMGTLDPLEALLGPFPCVRLRGLPFDATLENVCILMQGLVILDVLIVTESYGHGTGEAFVVFANPMDLTMALQRNNQMMGSKVIEIFQGKRSDYYAAIALQHAKQRSVVPEGEGNHQLDMHNQGNVWQVGVGAGNMPPQMQRNPMMPPPYIPQKVPSGGYTRVSGQTMGVPKGSSSSGNRTGRSSGETARPKGSNTGRGSGRGGGIQVGEHTGYLRMRGLPFTSTKEEIDAFFKDYNPIESSISLTYRSDGRATGEGYIAFNSPDDAKNAMALHRNTMGSRYIELFISNKEEHGRALSREASLR